MSGGAFVRPSQSVLDKLEKEIDMPAKNLCTIDGTMSATLIEWQPDGMALVDLGFGFTTSIARDRVAMLA